MGLQSLSDHINRLTGGAGSHEEIFIWKNGQVSGVATTAATSGVWYSQWLIEGRPWSGDAPVAGVIPTRATTGALGQQNPTTGTLYVTSIGASSTHSFYKNTVMYDRLFHIGGLSGTSTGAQTVNATVSRGDANGIGNQIWVEIYTALGASNTTISCHYTNQAGSAATSRTASIGGAGRNDVTMMLRLPLAHGDTGVTAISDITLAATTATAGNFGVTLVRPIISVEALNDSGLFNVLTHHSPGPRVIETDACLAFMSNYGYDNIFDGVISFVEV